LTRIDTPLVVIALATASQVAARIADGRRPLRLLLLASRLDVTLGRSHLQPRALHPDVETDVAAITLLNA
jgi:hypothetical protein